MMGDGWAWAAEGYWYDQRYDDAVWAQRVEEGRCGNCGAFDGPDHRCPTAGQER